MATGHPVDAQGRVLPRSSWPADRSAPDPLERVRRFCNTANLESGADRLADPADFDRWLGEQGLPPLDLSDGDLSRCHDVREALRAAATSHRRGESDRDAMGELERLLGDIRFVAVAGVDGLTTAIDPRQGACARLLGAIALAVTGATANGTWRRLKACRHCRWVVYDASKNRSAQWCSMSACGGRSKVQQHRARRRRPTPGGDDRRNVGTHDPERS